MPIPQTLRASEFSDTQITNIITDSVAMATRVHALRELLKIADGTSATVVRIDEVREIFGWRNDDPIVAPPPRRPLHRAINSKQTGDSVPAPAPQPEPTR